MGMKKNRFIIGTAIAVILTLFVFLNDAIIIKFIESLRNYYLDYIFISVTFASNTLIIFFFLTSLFLWKEYKRRWILPLWLTLFFSVIVSFFLKVLVKRFRPFQEGLVSVSQTAAYFMKDNMNVWNFSFPSFQAMLVFAALPLLNKEFRKFKYFWLIFACFVGFSRAYLGVHYLSDVFSGAIIGYLIGFLIILIEEKYQIGLGLMKKLKINK
jgi:undecaprenyl-diphosphatase